MRALVTGGRGGIGSAIVAALGEAEMTVLDLPEFDVGDPDAWRALEGVYDAAFLNAGIGIGFADVAELPDGEYRRILGANDGVVYGTRELAARLMPNGGSIVATASLAGLTGMPFDPSYTATKHAVVGWVRGAAPGLAARGIRINALCPGSPTRRSSWARCGQSPVAADGAGVRRWGRAPDPGGRGDRPRLHRATGPREPFRFRGIPGPR